MERAEILGRSAPRPTERSIASRHLHPNSAISLSLETTLLKPANSRTILEPPFDRVAFTPASVPFLRSKPDLGNLSAVAMGISRKYQDGLNPLPTVVSELDDIVKDPPVQGASGVLPGTILLNGQFPEKAMEDQLGGQHTVVHIASHFVLQPGDDSQSYLLLSGKDSEGIRIPPHRGRLSRQSEPEPHRYRVADALSLRDWR